MPYFSSFGRKLQITLLSYGNHNWQKKIKFGGVAILWRQIIDDKVKLLPDGSSRIICLELKINRKKICIINLYMPCIIIPLRRYLEKIKGCRRPDIFRIRPWARHSRIISGSAWVFFMSMHAYHRAFSPSRADTLMYFRATEAGLNKLFCLFLCLLSARFVGSKSSHFAVLKTVR